MKAKANKKKQTPGGDTIKRGIASVTAEHGQEDDASYVDVHEGNIAEVL